MYSNVYRSITFSVLYSELALPDHSKFLGITLIYSGLLIGIFVQLNLMFYSQIYCFGGEFLRAEKYQTERVITSDKGVILTLESLLFQVCRVCT